VTIRIWQAYSCNNSSYYRLVAQFADATLASAAVEPLSKFIDENWGEIDGREDDQPWVFVEDEVLFVFHSQCSGFGSVGSFLEERGASVDEQDHSEIQIAVLFRAPTGEPTLDRVLAQVFAQIAEGEGEVQPLKAPWVENEPYGTASCFRDAGTVGLCMPIDPRDLAGFKRWLALQGVDRPVIRIGDPNDKLTFATIADARCRSCNGALEYLDPRLHDIEAPQLVCRPCGGFYDLAAFMTAAT
jgi:hypothetical protein